MTKDKVQDLSVKKIIETVNELENSDLAEHFDEKKAVPFEVKTKLKITRTKETLEDLIKK